MKTSGFREIDFSKVLCTHCGFNAGYCSSGCNVIPPMGKVVNDQKAFVDCPQCKGNVYIDETTLPDLVLE